MHRGVEEAFTIQLTHHLSREAFLSNPHPQQFWFSGYRFLLACGTLYISLTLVTTVTSSYSCMYSLVTFSPLALHFVQSCAPVPNTAPGTPMLAQYLLRELSPASGLDAILLGRPHCGFSSPFPRVCGSPQTTGQEMYSCVHLSILPTLMGSDTSVQCCWVAIMNSLALKLAVAGGGLVCERLEGTPSALQAPGEEISDYPSRPALPVDPPLPLLCSPKLLFPQTLLPAAT